MNLTHIEAVMKTDRVLRSVFEGIPLASNGHIACAFTVPESAKDYPMLAESWAKWIAVEPKPSEIGGMVQGDPLIYRRIGPAAIAEAYFRCFAGDGVTWSATIRTEVVLVHEGLKLIGAVMPVRFHEELPAITVDVPDVIVFEPLANASNDYYLANDKVLLREVAELQEELESLETRRDETEGEITRIEREIERKNEAAQRKREATMAKG